MNTYFVQVTFAVMAETKTDAEWQVSEYLDDAAKTLPPDGHNIEAVYFDGVTEYDPSADVN